MKRIITSIILTTPLLTLPLTADIELIRGEIQKIETKKQHHQSAIDRGLDREVLVSIDEGQLKTCVVDHLIVSQSLENRLQKLKHILDKEERKALLSPQRFVASASVAQTTDEPMVGPITQQSNKEETLRPTSSQSSNDPAQDILRRSFESPTDTHVFTKSEAERLKTKLQLLHHKEEDPVWDKLFKTRYAMLQEKDSPEEVPHVSTTGDDAVQCKDDAATTGGEVKKVFPAISFTTHNPLPIPTQELDKELGSDHLNTVKLSTQLVELLEKDQKPTDLIGVHALRDDSILKPVYFIVLCELFLREKAYNNALQALGEALKSNITSNQSIKIKLYFSLISRFMPTDIESYRQISDILDM